MYSQYNKLYTDFENDFNKYAVIKFGIPLNEIEVTKKNKNDFNEMIEYYNLKNPLLTTKGTVNKVCEFMENNLAGVKRKTHNVEPSDIYEWLATPDFVVDNSKLVALSAKKEEYENFKKSKMLSESKYSTYENWYKAIRNDCLENISSNLDELTNLALYLCYVQHPKSKKDFVWDVFGIGIVNLLIEKHDKIKIPYRNDFGDFKYLGNFYDIAEISIKQIDDDEYKDLFEDLEDLYDDEVSDVDF